MIRLRYKKLEQLCQCRPLLWNDIWKVGRLSLDGCYVELEEDQFDQINREHSGPIPFGDIVEVLAKPVAAVLGDCVGCAERRLAFNLVGS